MQTRQRKAQISFEYLVIVGLAILVIVPALLFFLSFTGGSEDAVTHAKMGEIGSQMLKTSSDAYALGRHSWLTLDVTLPESTESVQIPLGTDELVFSYGTKYGTSQAVFFSKVPLQSEAADGILVQDRAGVVSFRFTSYGANVTVSNE